MVYHFEELGSTNDQAREPKYDCGDVITAEWQSAGRGQRGNVWQAPRSENLIFSMVLCPTFLALKEQFLISQVVALALVRSFEELGLEPRIKWTNDIYIGERKVCGVLIENVLQQGAIARSIVGVGVNVNQRTFDVSLPNPTSLSVEMGGVELSRADLLTTITTNISKGYEQLKSGNRAQITADYHSLLYRLGEWHPYRLASGEVVRRRLEGVLPTGELLLRDESEVVHEHLFKSVEFVIDARGDKI